MTSHPVVAQRNRGTSPGRDQWRMAPWEVPSINNLRRMPGQGKTAPTAYFVSCYVDPTPPQMLHFASISISSNMFVYPLCSACYWRRYLLLGDAIKLLNVTTKIFREGDVFVSANGDKRVRAWTRYNPQHWLLAHLSNPTPWWISGNIRKAIPTGRDSESPRGKDNLETPAVWTLQISPNFCVLVACKKDARQLSCSCLTWFEMFGVGVSERTHCTARLKL